MITHQFFATSLPLAAIFSSLYGTGFPAGGGFYPLRSWDADGSERMCHAASVALGVGALSLPEA